VITVWASRGTTGGPTVWSAILGLMLVGFVLYLGFTDE
jgi:hypothetical protein